LGSFLHRERADDRGAAAAQGACNSSRGAKRLVGDAVKTAALIGGAAVSVTVRMNAQIKAAIAAIAEDAWKSERVPGRLVVRRIPDFNAEKEARCTSSGMAVADRLDPVCALAA
jgi:hypothetical protein